MTAVFIPTRGRVGKQPTYDVLVRTGIETILVCPPNEVDGHKKSGYEVIGAEVEGITATRQWIMEYARSVGISKVMMFDDDLRFAYRTLENFGRFKPCDLQQTRTMLDRLESMLDQVPLVGLCNRGGANNTPTKDVPISECKRIFDVQCVDTNWFHSEGIQYRQPFMEDFDVSLQAHLKGYPSAMLTTHTKDNIGGAAAGGGCSIYRTMEGQAEAARALAALWPGFVSVREVEAKTKGEWGTRIDVKVKWVEAFKAGCELRDLLGKEQHPARDWSGIAPEWGIL